MPVSAPAEFVAVMRIGSDCSAKPRDGAPMPLPTRESPAEIAAHNALLARSEERLDTLAVRLAGHLRAHPEQNLAEWRWSVHE